MSKARNLLAPRTVLVAVDNVWGIRSLICKCLSAAGKQVLEAGSPEEAQKLATEHPGPVHLLLADASLPTMTGAALGRQLSASRPDLRVLCISGQDHAALIDGGILDAGTPFLPKPFTNQELLAKVREVLDS